MGKKEVRRYIQHALLFQQVVDVRKGSYRIPKVVSHFNAKGVVKGPYYIFAELYWAIYVIYIVSLNTFTTIFYVEYFVVIHLPYSRATSHGPKESANVNY